MTQKERIEQIETTALANRRAIQELQYGRIALVKDWKVYEDAYTAYLKRKNCFGKFLWRLFCRLTFRSTKLTKKELTKRTAKKMARIFYEGGD